MPQDLVLVAASSPPTRPRLSRSVALALRFATRALFPEDGAPRHVPDPEWVPPLLTSATLAEAQAAIAALEAFLAPVDPERLALRTAATLEHWFVAETDPAVREVADLDWLQAQAPYPEWALAEAHRDCVGNQARRPVPADIAQRCAALTGEARAELAQLRRLCSPEAQAAARARREAEIARQRQEEERREWNEAHPEGPVAYARRRFFQQEER